MNRYSDWHGRLDRFLIANRMTPFEWGAWDCSLWVASAIEAMTGVDIAADFRGKYSTAAGAIKIVLSFSAEASSEQLVPSDPGPAWGPMLAAMASAIAMSHQMTEVKPLMAQRGDMVATSQCLGLVALTGHQVLVVPDSGFHLVDISNIVRAWRVG